MKTTETGKHRFPYRWTLADAVFTKDKGKVFSCFACGGGSTMGYKLAGFDVVGCNEIDPRMNRVYVQNHHPKYNYLMDIRELVGKARAHELPEELYQLDVLDGSPPCSSFSVVGEREKGWGKEKKFREGQATQVLDTLFFDFIDLAEILKPKIVVAENVKGLLLGEARTYFFRILKSFEDAGYTVYYRLLDAGMMGVPQRRERIFFFAVRNDFRDIVPQEFNIFGGEPVLDMDFDEPMIPFMEIEDGKGSELSGKMRTLWDGRQETDGNLGDVCLRLYGKDTFFSDRFIHRGEICPTLTAKSDCLVLYDYPKFPSHDEVCLASTFPMDYDFMGSAPNYFCGMSVPPVMMAQIATRVYDQWLKVINGQ